MPSPRRARSGSCSGAGSCGTGWRSSRLVVLVLLSSPASVRAGSRRTRATSRTSPSATQSPSLDHLMGTDRLGRDLLTEILYAGQVSLSIGLAVAFFSTIFGALVGAFAAFFGRATDQVLSRITDLFLVVPALLVAATALSYVRRNSQVPVVGRRRQVPRRHDRHQGRDDRRARVPQLDLHRADRARSGALVEGEGVHRSRPRQRRVELADHLPPHHAELDRRHHRERDARRSRSRS